MPMFIGLLTVEFSLEDNDSLKGKRRIADSLKQKTRNAFNVAIAESGTENSLTRLKLCVVSLSNSEIHLRGRLEKCCQTMEVLCREPMVESQVEIDVFD